MRLLILATFLVAVSCSGDVPNHHRVRSFEDDLTVPTPERAFIVSDPMDAEELKAYVAAMEDDGWSVHNLVPVGSPVNDRYVVSFSRHVDGSRYDIEGLIDD